MITKADLEGNDKLKDLSPEHLAVVVELSSDDDASLRKELANVGEQNATNILNDVAIKIEEKFDIKRNEKEKTSDFVIRANEEFTTSKLKDSTTEIDTLKKKLEDGITDEDTKLELDKLKTDNGKMSELLKSEEEKFNGLIDKEKKALSDFKQDIHLKESIPTLKSDLDKFSRNSRIDTALTALRNDYELVYDEKDSTKLIAKKDYKEYDPAEVLKSHPALSDVLETKREQKGTGAGNEDSGTDKTEKKPDADKNKGDDIDAPDRASELTDLKGIEKTTKVQELAKKWVEEDLQIGILDPKYGKHMRAFVKQNS